MTIKIGWVVAVSALLSAAAGARGGAMMAAPDETPLLFDRLRAFPAVVVATTAAGFEKNPAPVRGTNCVQLPVKIEAVLKGDLKSGPFRLDVHEQLPALMAQRDANSAHRYLLVMGVEKGKGYLGGGMVYKDLERFYLTDAGLEKAAKVFIEANDVSAAAMFKLADGLLADKDVSASASACGHVYAVLARLAAKSDEDEWRAMDKALLKQTISRAGAAVREGNCAGPAAAVLVAMAGRTGNVELDSNLAGPARKWLSAEANAAAPAWRPDYMAADAMTPVIDLLGRLKDREARDLLVKIAKDNRWGGLRRAVMAALEQILTPEEMKELNLPQPRSIPGKLPRPIMRGGPEPFVPTDN